MQQFKAMAWSDETGHQRGSDGSGTVERELHGLGAVLWVATQKCFTSFACLEQILMVNSLHDELRTGGYPIEPNSLLEIGL
jgi:hypothetical protein